MYENSGSEVIRVLLVDDHAIVRDGIRAVLATVSGIEVVGEAQNGREAIHRALNLNPDVILMDLLMPEMDGITAIVEIRKRNPKVQILVLTSFAAEDKVFPAIKAGAMGYLLKDSHSEDLTRAIREVSRGESSLHPKIARMLLREISDERDLAHHQAQDAEVDPLTGREVQILKLVAKGKSNQEIADEMVVSEGTVRTHVSNILSKLQLASRTQATLYALREGLASLDEPDAP